MNMQKQRCLAERIMYSPGGILYEAESRIPFARKLSKHEADALAENFAMHVLEMTFEEHEVVDESDHFGVRYAVKPKQGRHPNYRLMATLAMGVEGAKGMLYIRRGITCSHDREVLESYEPDPLFLWLLEREKI